MAAEPKALFTVDAGKILTKLHLAGQQQITQGWVYNTAIKEPTDNADPSNPGKTTFDLSSKDGKYEVVFCRSDFSYQLPIDPKKNKTIAALEDELKKMKEETDKKPLTGDAGKKNTDKVREKQEALIKEYSKYKLQKPFDEAKDDPAKTLENIKAAIIAENKFREEEKSKKAEEYTKSADEQLKTYFENFAGKDRASKIKPDAIVQGLVDISGKVTSPTKVSKDAVKDFKYEFLDEKELKKTSEKAQAAKPDDYINGTIGFKVGYEVQIDTL